VVVPVGSTVNEPLSPRPPLQPPLASQAVAFVLDHVSTELSPAVIVLGLALRVTVGAAGGGGPDCAITTVIDVGSQADVLPSASVAQTLKSYLPGTLGVPVRFPLGLTIMPSGGAPAARVADS
jgi:hypothetical protein